MKNFALCVLLLLIGMSCEKAEPVLSEEIPHWLQIRIEKVEEEINSDPMSSMGFTAWIRYEFQNEKYYENDIPFSSYFPHLYDKNGEALTSNTFPVSEYLANKCCKKIMWKGPDYP